MHELVSLNGTIADPGTAAISALSSAALYGRGVFTTVRVITGEPFLWKKHLHRLLGDARKLGIDGGGITGSGLFTALRELIDLQGIAHGKARITIFSETASPLWPVRDAKGTSILIQTGDLPSAPDHMRVCRSRYSVNRFSRLAGIKSCNYLEPVLALEEAGAKGFDEAIRVERDGSVVSGCVSNVFWRSRSSGELLTPGRGTGCLPGTTREFIIEELGASEVECSFDEFLRDVRSLFLTSSVKGIAQVSYLEGAGELELPDSQILHLIPDSLLPGSR